jgi:hypothetical protein
MRYFLVLSWKEEAELAPSLGAARVVRNGKRNKKLVKVGDWRYNRPRSGSEVGNPG